jgi:hypothetical protein
VTFRAIARLVAENFSLTEEQTVRVKGDDEITSGALQSLDDLEASYRFKGGTGHKGYDLNVTEAAGLRNEMQLITQVQVGPNNTQDTRLLCEALPELNELTDLTVLYGDGGYGRRSSLMSMSAAASAASRPGPAQSTLLPCAMRPSSNRHFQLDQPILSVFPNSSRVFVRLL